VEDEKYPKETNAVLLMKRLNFPVKVAEGILEESSEVLKGSPLLCHIAGLSCGKNKLLEITVSFFSKSSIFRKY
jgi:hypothetical protein